MKTRWFSVLLPLMALGWALLLGGADPCYAQSEQPDPVAALEARKPAAQRRWEAKKRVEAMKAGQSPEQAYEGAVAASAAIEAAATPQPVAFTPLPTGVNPQVDMSLPNFANSPSIRKFVDSLPGLGAAAANNLGQYIPVAVADTTTYPGSDYYEIAVVEYREQMHSDLPPVVGAKMDPAANGGTKLRGYVQLNGGDPVPHYLGPLILARKGRPVRVKFVNNLPTGAAGNLFIPVDKSIMGSGMGPLPMPGMPNMLEDYPQNRATLHLHGGLSPWISDGTPHQWTAPAMEMTSYPKGVSVVNVPDMPDPGPGALTFYWTNEQAARLMFYHDHAWGITRLNVYVGEAAGYLITDDVEEDLISGANLSGANLPKVLPDAGGLNHYGIPLVIQDKTFVNDPTTPAGPGFPAGYTPTPTTEAVDPLWYLHIPGSRGGDLWWPHEYLPNENIWDGTGFWPMGRWDYGPWIIPPMVVMNNTLPSPSAVPESFQDTAVVNGTAFPYVELPPTAVRFRILNACNDRFLNLQVYKADPAGHMVTDAAGMSWGTEVKMVPAVPRTDHPNWPRDGRDGGVPDPTTAGPEIIQIGNEGGFLAQAAVIPAQPVDFDYDRRSATFGGVSSVALFMPPAVRADVIVDLSRCVEGDTLILYNDAPAPVPLYDTRYDYFADCPDQRSIGGAPSVAPGYGPNTRTILQIRIKGTSPATYDFRPPNGPDLLALQAALPKAFAAAQHKPPVPAAHYNDAYGTADPNIFANVADETLNVTGTTQGVASVILELPGLGYTTPPMVNFYGGGGSGAAAVASLNGVTGLVLTAGGTGYVTAPIVTITTAVGDTGAGATAEAIVSGGVVTTLVVTNPGSNYLLPPTVTLAGGGGTGATATAAITIGSVGAITVTNPGSGYIRAPYVYLTGGGGTGARALARLNGDMVMDGKTLIEGMDMEFGRMNAQLGSIPNPLTPTVGAGPVPAPNFYIDPPTELLNPEETRLWRISHVGVDSHSLHFHLFDVQVINRVDWTNTVSPPYPEEIGWKETIRTNPIEDIIVALRPSVSAMKLPFGLPESNRLLDPSMPAGAVGHFTPAAPPIGVPAVAQLTNVMTNFCWEYVWHCHLLGHEENDMMRPIVFKVPSVTPGAPASLSGAVVNGQVQLTWADPTPYDYATGQPVSTLGNPANEVGFRIQRSPNNNQYVEIGTALANATTFTDATAAMGSTYRYRIFAYNAAGTSARSNVLTITVAPPPVAPTNLTAILQAGPAVALTWRDNATNETGFVIERSDDGAPFVQIGTRGSRNSTGNVTWTDSSPASGVTCVYRVAATRAGVNSSYTTSAPLVVPPVPAAPANLVATAVRAGTRANVTLTWADNANNETSYTIERATNSSFTAGYSATAVAANTTSYTVSLARVRTYWFRVRANNDAGSSAWSNVFTITTP